MITLKTKFGDFEKAKYDCYKLNFEGVDLTISENFIGELGMAKAEKIIDYVFENKTEIFNQIIERNLEVANFTWLSNPGHTDELTKEEFFKKLSLIGISVDEDKEEHEYSTVYIDTCHLLAAGIYEFSINSKLEMYIY